jgi:histidine triad (HIT) family protein
MDDCIFCKIVAKKIPAKIVYEDEKILAFDDLRPQAPTHTLIIPKEHYAALPDVPADKCGLIAHIFSKAPRIAEAKGIGRTGYRIVLNTGKDSGQDVFHIHFHLLGGRPMAWPPG